MAGSIVRERIQASSDKPVYVDDMVESTDSFLDITFEL